MGDLIKALQIFLKYDDREYPTNCSHDLLAIMGIDPDLVSEDDKEKLEELGFTVMDDYGDEFFGSFRYGSA